MAYNLFVAYDLDKPGQNYDAVHAKIKSLGRWYHAQQSLFYVNTALSPKEAHAAISTVIDANDRLMVVEANGAVMYPAPPADIEAINRVWFNAA